MAGKHEPASKRSFYYSLTTATLRGILVIAALVLGVFVLSKAFPTAGDVTVPQGQDQPPPGESPTVPASPTPTPTGVEPEAPDPFEGVVVAVLNGTDVSGLAAETAKFLQRKGIDAPDDSVGDATRNYDVTTIFYRPDSRDAAEELQARFFPSAVLERSPQDADPNFDITVVLGADFAAEQDQAGA